MKEDKPKQGFDIEYKWRNDPKRGEPFMTTNKHIEFYDDIKALVEKYGIVELFDTVTIDFTKMDRDG